MTYTMVQSDVQAEVLEESMIGIFTAGVPLDSAGSSLSADNTAGPYAGGGQGHLVALPEDGDARVITA